MNPSSPIVISDRVICGPDLQVMRLTDAAGGEGQAVLDVAVLLPVDLSSTHGVDVTLKRLKELAASYSPAIEMASLNFDHAYGGPSLGWCQSLELKDSTLWARYVDLDASVVVGIQTKRYTRQSSEFVLEHPATGGWYFTGLALLGNARPAISGLPPVTLFRPVYKELEVKKKTAPEDDVEVDPEDIAEGAPEEPDTKKKKAAKKPKKAPAKVAASAHEDENEDEEDAVPASDRNEDAKVLAASARHAVKLVAELRLENAKLKAGSLLNAIGTRVTPAMRRLAHPILAELLSAEKPHTIRLSDSRGKVVERATSDVLVELLSLAPEFTALEAGELATEDPELESALSASSGVKPKRLAALQAKYGFLGSFGFQK